MVYNRIQDNIKFLNEEYNTLLLDRDGTLNVHIIGDYVRKWEDFEFVPGVLELMPILASKFKYIFIVTNQRGVGKGLYTEEDLQTIHQNMIATIEQVGGRIDGIYYCTSIEEDNYYRKPNRGLFEQILSEHPDVVPEKTIMIGDGDVDMEFARNCGICGLKIDSLKKEGDKYFWVRVQQ